MQLNRYIISLLAMLCVACSTPEIDDAAQSGESGSLLMSFALTRSSSSTLSSDDLLESATLRIYNSTSMGGGLVRYYKDLREDIIDYMAVGDYSAQIQIGEETASTYSIDDVSYSGQSDIKIVSQQTADVEMDVTMQNTMATIVFDDTLNDHYTGYYATVSAANSATDITESTPSLTFDGTHDDGYLIIPDGVDNLVWRFYDNTGLITQGLIEDAQRAYQYKLTFKHTDYLDVSPMTISIDGVEVFDDIIGFKPQPVIKGSEFNLDQTQAFISGDYELSITSLFDVTSISVTTVEQSYSWGVDSEVSYDSSTMTLTLSEDIFSSIAQGGESTVDIEVTDSNSSTGHAEMSVITSGLIGASVEDFWNNTATIVWYTTTPSEQVSIECRQSGAEEWTNSINATSTDGGYTWSADISYVEWSYIKNDAGLDTWQFTRGYTPSTEFEIRATVDNVSKVASHTSAETSQSITSVSNSSLSCYTASNDSATFWASGNNGYCGSLCSYDSATGFADLNSQNITVVIVTKFAAGNLYTGIFDMDSTDGEASFGQPFDWTARPKSLKFNYKVSVGSDDRGRVFFAIVDWSSRRKVTTPGLGGDTTGSWDPTNTSSLTEGQIIGYGSVYFDNNVSSETEFDLPIYYYDTDTKPTGNYSIVISATASYDGENLNGSTGSELWVKDFKFGY